MAALGKMLIILGAVIVLVGIGLLFAHKIPYIGRLPGDIYVRKDSFTFYFPLTTSIIVTLVLTVLFWLFRK